MLFIKKNTIFSSKNLEIKKLFVPLQSQTKTTCRLGNRPAEVAQLVEHNLAKVGVASSSLVFRSKSSQQQC